MFRQTSRRTGLFLQPTTKHVSSDGFIWSSGRVHIQNVTDQPSLSRRWCQHHTKQRNQHFSIWSFRAELVWGILSIWLIYWIRASNNSSVNIDCSGRVPQGKSDDEAVHGRPWSGTSQTLIPDLWSNFEKRCRDMDQDLTDRGPEGGWTLQIFSIPCCQERLSHFSSLVLHQDHWRSVIIFLPAIRLQPCLYHTFQKDFTLDSDTLSQMIQTSGHIIQYRNRAAHAPFSLYSWWEQQSSRK